MRLVLDLQTLQSASRNRGIGRYSDGLARAIARQSQDIELFALQNAAMPLATGEGRAMLDGLVPSSNVSVFAGLQGTRGIVANNRDRSAASDIVRDLHLERLRPNAVHVASPFEGFGDNTVVGTDDIPRSYTSVATVYDLIVFEDHEVHLPTELHREWFGAKLDRLRRADLILAISEHTRNRVINRLGIAPERVVTIMGDTSDVFRPLNMPPAERAAVLKKYGIEKPFVMHTGILESRKNVAGLVEAFSRLSPELRANYQIVFAANSTHHQREQLQRHANQFGIDSSTLIFAGYVPDEDLVRLYNLCGVLAFPSFAEGLGLPPLEAMRCGSIAIGASTTSTAEVIGDRELLFDPHDTNAFATTLSRVLDDSEFRRAKLLSCRHQQQKFSWDGSAALALAAIWEASSRREAEKATTPRLIPAARSYRVGPGAPDAKTLTDLTRQPGFIVWEGSAANTVVHASREARYNALGYKALVSDASLDSKTIWEAAPGVLASLSQSELDLHTSVARETLHIASTAREALDRAANVIRQADGQSDSFAIEFANALADTIRQPSQPRLFVDISELAKRDARSGVQRVTRNIITHLLRDPQSLRVEPIYEAGGVFRYARAFTARLLDQEPLDLEDGVVDFQPGDRFLGLDLNILISDSALAMLERHRRRGLSVWFVVYDLLPLLMPEYFHSGLRLPFHRWISRLASVSDGLVAISRSVADEIALYLDEIRPERSETLQIKHFNLGGDLDGQIVLPELSESDIAVLSALRNRTYFLKVGTLEPRKGHGQLLDAFELLWQQGSDACLLLIGKAGWLTDDLISRVEEHPEFGKRLFWLSGASDHALDLLYANAAAVIQSSYGEGYGLPLVEAARHETPIIARDIPVFRELADGHATFFADDGANAIAETVAAWLRMQPSDRPVSSGLPWITWQRSAADLVAIISSRKPYRRWSTSDIWHRTPTHPEMISKTGRLERGKLLADAPEGVLLDLPVTDLADGAYELEIVVEAPAGSTALLRGSWLAGEQHAESWAISPSNEEDTQQRHIVTVPRGKIAPRLVLEHLQPGPLTLRAIWLRPFGSREAAKS